MFILIILVLISVLLVIIVAFSVFWLKTSDVRYLVTSNPEESAFMLFRQRQHNYGPNAKRHKWVKLSTISHYLIQSAIIAEDSNFLFHHGFNWEEIWISFLSNIRHRRIVKGGSSITQQLAKNIFLTPSRSTLRKIREILITIKIERELTKYRILELYLNLIEWGENIYGAEEASRHYFNKSASELSLSEAIRLSVTIPNPRLYSPLDNTNDILKTSQKRVLMGLLKQGLISRPKYVQTYMDLHKFFEAGYSAPELVPFKEVPAGFASPDFWITKIRDPDKRIMNEEEIEIFNRRACLISSGINIFTLPEFVSPRETKEKIVEVSGLEPYLSSSLDIFYGAKEAELLTSLYLSEIHTRFDQNNEPLKADLYVDILRSMNIDELNEARKLRFALTVCRTDILAWPYEEIVMNKKFDYDFNRLQQSSLNFAEPVAVIHESRDGRWVFIRSRYVDGWVKTSDLAFTVRAVAIDYPGDKFLVVTHSSWRTESGTNLQMGTRMILTGKSSNFYEIDIPARDDKGELILKRDRVSVKHVNEGFVHYTKANSLKMAFELLGTSYGWGGAKGGVDCSSYMQKVFSVFGILLPRNSSLQTLVGGNISRFSNLKQSLELKRAQIGKRESAITLLRFPGHIMLYLGEEGGKDYVIHSVWGISGEDNKIFHINKVSVTDLHLGEGSVNGSLLERISEVAAIHPAPTGLKSLIRDFSSALYRHPWRIKLLLTAVAALFVGIMTLVVLLPRLIFSL